MPRVSKDVRGNETDVITAKRKKTRGILAVGQKLIVYVIIHNIHALDCKGPRSISGL